MELLVWFSTLLIFIGLLLNNLQNRKCFLFWIIANSIRFLIHLKIGQQAFAAGDMVFLLLAIHGLISWSNKRNKSYGKSRTN